MHPTNKTHPFEMNATETNQAAEVMLAWAEGKPCQTRFNNGSEWRDLLATMPSWDWHQFDYRIKPAATVRPWTFETFPAGRVRVRSKNSGRVGYIISYPECCAVIFAPSVNSGEMSYRELSEEWEQLSGAPCGTTDAQP
jgi:hypothetical protein